MIDRPAWVVRCVEEMGFGWVGVHWDRAAAVPGAWFDHAKAEKVVQLWPRVFRLTMDRFAAKPFRLNDYQEAIVRLLIGWKVPIEVTDEQTGQPVVVHVRLYRQLRLWIPRKNGKTEFLSALALLFFLLEGVVAGEGYVFARDEDQAKIPFARMQGMLTYSPTLNRGQILVTKRSIWHRELRAAFNLLTGRGEGKHGKSPTVILGDEMHEWETLDVMNNLRQGTGTRLQPMELYASTAGLKTQVVGLQLWEESLGILEGKIVDPTTLVVIFAAGDDDDWTDDRVIAKANPQIGVSPTWTFVRRELSLAKGNPRAEAHFKRYHLNQWVEHLVRWLPARKWNECSSGPNAWRDFAERLKGRECYVAVDLARNFDFAAEVLWFLPIEGETRPILLCRFWLPEETIETRVREERLHFDKWRDAEALHEIPGGVIDQNVIMRQVLADARDYEMLSFGYDPWNADKFHTDLVAEGLDESLFVEIRMGHRTLGEATRDFENKVFSAGLDHGGQPVLAWMAGNAAVRFDENMNFVPAKKRSKQNIDGIVAAVMCNALALQGAHPSRSFWERAA